MPDIDELIAKLEAETKRFTRFNDEREIKAQRATMPTHPGSYYGLPEPNERRTIDLVSEDKAFLQFIRHGVAGMDSSERKALVEDATGQYLVSPVITTEIDRAVAELVVMRGLCAKKTIDKDRLQVRAIGEASVGWGKLETGTDITESSMTPTAPTYKYVEDLYGLSKIGEDELSDNDFDLANLLVDSFARAIAEAEDMAFVAGTGHDNSQPEGFTVDTTLAAATTI